MVKALNSPESWSLTKLDEVITRILSGGTPSTKRSDFWHGSIPWITSKWLNDRLYLTSGEKFISTEAVKKSASKIVPSGNIVFATRVGVGKAALNAIDIAINQDLAGLIVDQKQVHVPFLVYQLRSDEIQRYVEQNKRGATIKGITQDCLRNINIQTPSLPEQQKIAALLLAVQRAFEQQERLIALTTELKKALMHKLFTEGTRGEKQKQTEIGPVPESWEVAQIGDVCEVKGGKRLPKGSRLQEKLTEYPYIRVTDFEDYSVREADVRYISEHIHESIRRYIINAEDIFISIAGSIGIVGMVPYSLNGANLTENAARLILKSDVPVVSEFVMYWLASEKAQKEISAQTVKNAQPKLALARIKTLKIPIPSVDEQVNILEALEMIRSKRKFHREVSSLQHVLFRTLLHQLMTAQIRVNDLDLTELDHEPIAAGKEEVI